MVPTHQVLGAVARVRGVLSWASAKPVCRRYALVGWQRCLDSLHGNSAGYMASWKPGESRRFGRWCFESFRQVRRAAEAERQMAGRVGGLAGSAAHQRSQREKKSQGSSRSVLVEVEEEPGGRRVGVMERRSVASKHAADANDPAAGWAPLEMCCEVRQ